MPVSCHPHPQRPPEGNNGEPFTQRDRAPRHGQQGREDPPGPGRGLRAKGGLPARPYGSAPLEPAAAPSPPGSRAGRHSGPEEQQAPCCGPRAGRQEREWEPGGASSAGEGCLGTRRGHTAPHNSPAPAPRRCLPPDTEAAYMAMAKGEHDLKRRRKNKAR